jgi:hypothetical protein
VCVCMYVCLFIWSLRTVTSRVVEKKICSVNIHANAYAHRYIHTYIHTRVQVRCIHARLRPVRDDVLR